MSTISAINSVSSQLSSLSTDSSSVKDSILNAESFETALDIAMDAKSLVLPTPVNSAVDLGVEMLEEKGVLSTVTETTSLKDSIEGVFDELSIGIASSFVAALAGADSATAVTADEDTTDEATALSAASSTTTDEASDDAGLFSANTVSTIKETFDDVAPYFSDSKAVPIASSALGALEDVLLDEEDEKS